MADITSGAMNNQASTKGSNKYLGKAFTPMGQFGIGAAVDTYMNLKAGDDFGTSLVKGAASGMLWAAAPGVMTAHMLATTVPAAAQGVAMWQKKKSAWWNQQHLANFGGNYQDTQRALTMRQAAVQQIEGSKLNARSALGGEARIMHQGMFRS